MNGRGGNGMSREGRKRCEMGGTGEARDRSERRAGFLGFFWREEGVRGARLAWWVRGWVLARVLGYLDEGLVC